MTLESLFSAVWEMSLTGAIVIVVVVLARLCLKRLPKAFSYALWAVVLFRLLCPVSLTSPVSLFSVVKPLELPGATKAEGILVDGFMSVPEDRLEPIDPSRINGDVVFHTYPVTNPIPIEETETFAFETVWLVGIAVGAVWGIVSSFRLRRRLVGSVDAGGRVRLADHIDTPFVFGLFRPKIYLPSELDLGKQPYILCHEQYHIRRGDHVWRFLAYAALCIHWFNPLVWLAFYLSGKD
ncbi:MAG: peptidase M56, partial [Clostridia bacterium]|nr:peptidase M56 [Clostridia bacterium]